jgi:methionyl aminopeptidase
MTDPIEIKTPEEIEKMRIAGRLAGEVLTYIEPYIQPGITTDEINTLAHNYIVNVQQAIPACLNYQPMYCTPFPKSICTSVNQVICHGIPGPKKLKSGDIVNVDVTVIKDGFHGDTSKMFMIGKPSILAERLIRVTHECMWLGISQVKAGALLGDIAHAIQFHAEKNRFSIVREYSGHGIGRKFHMEPSILHFGNPGTGMALRAGMTFTIEPMVNAGKRHIKHLPDGWTVLTKDHSLSAQWEHTILVTEDGFEVLTLRAGEKPNLPTT